MRLSSSNKPIYSSLTGESLWNDEFTSTVTSIVHLIYNRYKIELENGYQIRLLEPSIDIFQVGTKVHVKHVYDEKHISPYSGNGHYEINVVPDNSKPL